MKKISDEDLIGYLLGALEPSEINQVENALAGDIALRERLAELEEKLGGMPDRFVEIDPPPGLAEKTLNTIGIVDSSIHADPSSIKSPLIEPANKQGIKFTNGFQQPEYEISGDRGSWSMMDMVVGAAVCFVVAALLLPSIANSRFQSKLVVCQDNLRQIGYNMASLAENHDGRFVISSDTDQWEASLFVRQMIDSELVSDTQTLICPSDPSKELTAEICRLVWQTEQSVGNDADYSQTMPRADNSLTQSVVAKNALQQTEAASGSYGFPAPQLTSAKTTSIMIPGSASQVLCADAACFENPGYRSKNHGGYGQNVLLGDLSVDYICDTACLPSGDHIYTNGIGRIQPGMFPGDNLIYQGTLRVER